MSANSVIVSCHEINASLITQNRKSAYLIIATLALITKVLSNLFSVFAAHWGTDFSELNYI